MSSSRRRPELRLSISQGRDGSQYHRGGTPEKSPSSGKYFLLTSPFIEQIICPIKSTSCKGRSDASMFPVKPSGAVSKNNLSHPSRPSHRSGLDVLRSTLPRRPFAPFDVKRRSGGVGQPQPLALPAGFRIVDPAVQPFGEEADRIRAREGRRTSHPTGPAAHRSHFR